MRIKQRILSLLLAGALLVPGLPAASAAGSGAFYSEHYDTLIPANAVQALGGSLS